MTAILFDLDGTLVDSSPGILNAFQYTFKQMNHIVPDASLLSTYIGPPLETTLEPFLKIKTKLNKLFYILEHSTKNLESIKYLSTMTSRHF